MTGTGTSRCLTNRVFLQQHNHNPQPADARFRQCRDRPVRPDTDEPSNPAWPTTLSYNSLTGETHVKIRTYVISGSASGIGRATSELLTSRGHRVIGVDLHDAEIVADLSDSAVRDSLSERIASLATEGIDGVLAVAGGPAEVNYFGAVALLQGLRPILAQSYAPRAVVVSSFAGFGEVDERLVDAYLNGDQHTVQKEVDRVTRAGLEGLLYPSSKRAIARWVRRNAISDQWAGANISLNSIMPGVIRTPMTEPFLATAEGRKALLAMVPMPLNGPADPLAAAQFLAWLVSDENSHLTGQVIGLDGGADAVTRGEDIFTGHEMKSSADLAAAAMATLVRR